MDIRIIQYGSDEYKKECELRNRILRAPLGLNLYNDNLLLEKDYLHIGIFEGEAIKACAISVVDTYAQIKQVAVDKNCQRKGYGKIVMETMEAELLKRGYVSWFLNARNTAIGFYEKLGYKCVGEEFVQSTIRHRKMVKKLILQKLDKSIKAGRS